ncbi:MAG: gluconate kinase [Gammaproteobacteria bacterium]|nr:MAG: gluconate kinase [Gammaproteobacteria bacterium]
MAKALQLIVMGVSGCGKSTVAEALAKHFGYPYLEGDSYHSIANIDKMRRGQPLNDDDRQGWLETLNSLLKKQTGGVVLSCSALKPLYRTILCDGISNPVFVYLKGDFDTILTRLQTREGHFFQGQAMLQSQFDTLIEPTGNNVITVDIRLSISEIVTQVAKELSKR